MKWNLLIKVFEDFISLIQELVKMVIRSDAFSDYGSPKWQVFNMPSKSATQYSLILGLKRDFQLAIENLCIQDLNDIRMSSCCVIDGSENYSSLNGKYVDIIFFDGVAAGSHCSCLLLKMFLPQQLITKKSNRLLIFLKKLKRNIIYSWQSTTMYIKCEDSVKWELFYDLFEFLLTITTKSIIGTQFYCPLICKHLILKELILLHMLQNKHANMKAVRKGEVQNDLNQNLSKFVSSKRNLQVQRIKSGKSTRALSKIQFDVKTCLKYKAVKNSKDNVSKINLKRKAICVNNNSSSKALKFSHNLCEKICKCQQNKWKVLKHFKKYNLYNYTEILQNKCLFDSLEITETPVETSASPNNILPSHSIQVKSFDSKPTSFKENLVKASNIATKEDPLKASHAILGINELYSKVNDYTSSHIKDSTAFNFCMPITTEIRVAKGCNEAIVNESTGEWKHFQGIDLETSSHTSGDSHNKKYLHNERVHEKQEEICTEVKLPLVAFQTASGKRLKVSESALHIAQNLYKEVCSQELNSSKNEQNNVLSMQKENEKDYYSKSTPSKKSYDKKYFNDGIESALTERFSIDIPFDEKETKCKPDDKDNQSSFLHSNIINKSSQLGKVRKSLGGRRSLKPYSGKKLAK